MKKGLVVLSGIAAVGSAIGGSIVFLKKKDICPKCEIKRALAKTQIHYTKDEMYNNGTGMTPPMGWSSWNLFRNKIDENLILDIASAVEKSGLKDAGYVYINLDDCWQSSMRDDNGRLQGDLTTFKHGIKWLTEQVNDLGLKLGIYSSNGILTCEDLPASLYHERIDAETFAEWGVEYFKYDFCHNKPIPTDAPKIDSITVSGNGIDGEIVFTAKDAVLKGEAKIVEEKDGKCYIKGLDSNLGIAEFNNIVVDDDGEYVLTLLMVKAVNKGEFCVVTVNGTDKYEFSIDMQRQNVTREGRRQIKIYLKKGTNSISFTNPVGSSMDSAAMQYEKMGRELVRATKRFAEENKCEEKKILFSICEWGLRKPWKWGGKAGNVWRTTVDIQANWPSIMGIYEFNVRLDEYARPGAFNDPDMLEVGNGKLTYEENKSHFTLWSMMAAPLILGNDIREFIKPDGTVDSDNKVLQILTNKDVIAVNQDKLGIQCKRIKSGLKDVLVKPLENNEVAVCLFNKTNTRTVIDCSMTDVHNVMNVTLPKSDKYVCMELWDKTETIVTDTISSSVEPHGVKIYKISVN